MSKLDLIKEWIARAQSKASALRTRLSPSIASDERGLFDVGSWFLVVLVAAIFGVTLAMMGAIEWIVEQIAKGVHLTGILIHVPQLQIKGMMINYQWPGPHPLPGFILAARDAGGSLYSIFQLISVVVLTAGFILIGLSHVLEQFNLMSSGTSEKLLSESVLIIILIFIFPYFYNASAAALNAADEKVILSPTVPENISDEYAQRHPSGTKIGPKAITMDIAKAAGTAPGGAVVPDIGLGALGDWLHRMSPDRAITVLVTMTASFMAVLIAFATGVFKIIATVALAAAFPLILSMRLIPFLRDVTDRLTSSLIGLMLASLVIAVFFRIGWGILVMIWGNLTFRWAVGVALLMAAAGAFTITAPAMSGMSAEISGTLGRSTAGAVGGMVATGGTAALGGVAGAGRAGISAIRGGAGKAGVTAAMGRGFGKGVLRGAPGSDVVGSMKSGAAGGKEAAMEHLADTPGAGGQHAETSAVLTERLTDEFERQKGKPIKALSDEDMQAGKAAMGAIKNENLNPQEAHYSNAKAREVVRDEEGKWTDTRIEAVREKGEKTTDEITQGYKDAIAEVKDRDDWEDSEEREAQLHAALGKVIKGKKPGE